MHECSECDRDCGCTHDRECDCYPCECTKPALTWKGKATDGSGIVGRNSDGKHAASIERNGTMWGLNYNVRWTGSEGPAIATYQTIRECKARAERELA